MHRRVRDLEAKLAREAEKAAEWRREAERHLRAHVRAEGRYEALRRQRDEWQAILLKAVIASARQRDRLEAELARVHGATRPFIPWAAVKAKKAAIDKANGRTPIPHNPLQNP